MGEYGQMMAAARQCGLNVLSREHAAQLLAVTYLWGDEASVFSERMHDDIKAAQERFGIFGGGIPDKEFVHALNEKVREVRGGKADWLRGFEERYGVTLPKWEEPRKEVPGDGLCVPTS